MYEMIRTSGSSLECDFFSKRFTNLELNDMMFVQLDKYLINEIEPTQERYSDC